jgi:hypothetical protein
MGGLMRLQRKNGKAGLRQKLGEQALADWRWCVARGQLGGA